MQLFILIIFKPAHTGSWTAYPSWAWEETCCLLRFNAYRRFHSLAYLACCEGFCVFGIYKLPGLKDNYESSCDEDDEGLWMPLAWRGEVTAMYSVHSLSMPHVFPHGSKYQHLFHVISLSTFGSTNHTSPIATLQRYNLDRSWRCMVSMYQSSFPYEQTTPAL